MGLGRVTSLTPVGNIVTQSLNDPSEVPFLHKKLLWLDAFAYFAPQEELLSRAVKDLHKEY